jgi:hypothetical protein
MHHRARISVDVERVAMARPISEAWGLREMTEADTLLSLDPSPQQEGSGSVMPQNIVFLNASAVFLGI